MQTSAHIGRLRLDARGFHVAEVSLGSNTVRFDDSCGSWTATSDPREDPGSTTCTRREAARSVARVLQLELRARQVVSVPKSR